MSLIIYCALSLLSILGIIHATPISHVSGTPSGTSLQPRQDPVTDVEVAVEFAVGMYYAMTEESIGADFISDINSAGNAAFNAFKGLPSVRIPTGLIG
jgi:hypothetical protein